MSDSRPTDAARLVAQQAEDAGLWCCAQTAAEAYLQQALWALHDAVESDATPEWRPLRSFLTEKPQ